MTWWQLVAAAVTGGAVVGAAAGLLAIHRQIARERRALDAARREADRHAADRRG